MKRTTIITAASIAALSAAIATSGRAAADEKPIVIGFAVAQTGWMAPYDNGYHAAELAIDELNAKGGIMVGRSRRSTPTPRPTAPKAPRRASRWSSRAPTSSS